MNRPLTLADPVITGTTALGDDAVLVDYLQEHDATLADVLTLYAGTPPDFTDGLRQSALALYLRHTEPALDRHRQVARLGHPVPANLPPQVAHELGRAGAVQYIRASDATRCMGVVDNDRSRIILPCYCDGGQPYLCLSDAYGSPTMKDFCPISLKRCCFRQDRFKQSFWLGRCPKCHTLYWACSPSPVMIRALKQRVLALFGDTGIVALLRLHIAAGTLVLPSTTS